MCCSVFGKLMSAFDAIKAVRYGPEWTDGHISSPQTNIFGDITNHRLAAVTWLIPTRTIPIIRGPPPTPDRRGSQASSMRSARVPYRKLTAILILWDDWGGLYDNLNPPQLDYGGLGLRVPAIVVSPYAKAGYVSPTQYEFGSILKYVENNWKLGSLKRTDARATSIGDCFDYSQKPIAFEPISAVRARTSSTASRLTCPSTPS